jgi:hypothetical protein
MTRRYRTKLTVRAELAWLDWQDAIFDTMQSGDNADCKAHEDKCRDRFLDEFMPPEFRVLLSKIASGA